MFCFFFNFGWFSVWEAELLDSLLFSSYRWIMTSVVTGSASLNNLINLFLHGYPYAVTIMTMMLSTLPFPRHFQIYLFRIIDTVKRAGIRDPNTWWTMSVYLQVHSCDSENTHSTQNISSLYGKEECGNHLLKFTGQQLDSLCYY